MKSMKATASKGLVADSNKDITGLRNLSIEGDLTIKERELIFICDLNCWVLGASRLHGNVWG